MLGSFLFLLFVSCLEQKPAKPCFISVDSFNVAEKDISFGLETVKSHSAHLHLPLNLEKNMCRQETQTGREINRWVLLEIKKTWVIAAHGFQLH